ncbi:acyl-CoA carboxylase subunit epsilon [Streptomyces sp. ET3-23]|uniref:acyl-CoA carboxylase epsilon subunit n=1 Tax=Streptomyces sp. ET3-23 TaxID=2885643 RepID=UPI001D0FEA38|nr:acyl-CoA carboxylase epsilon subunit [Streptomyces sp. ET3-23]MCC2280448.1 acyl-CoA carboxylase subunit epsilon [Streptomyces sp. ET3-23]
MNEPSGRPLLRVEKGDPSDDELAALAAVLLARAGSLRRAGPERHTADARPEPAWCRPEHLPLFVNPRGWR